MAIDDLSDKLLKELMDFYVKYRVEYGFMKVSFWQYGHTHTHTHTHTRGVHSHTHVQKEDLEKIDLAEFNVMCKDPSWTMGYVEDIFKNHMPEAFKLCDKVTSRKEMRILMVGLDEAGKTAILYKLKVWCKLMNTLCTKSQTRNRKVYFCTKSHHCFVPSLSVVYGGHVPVHRMCSLA